MPYAFGFVGIVLLIAGARGTSEELLTKLKDDLTGPNNFVFWILAIGTIGALGYVDTLRPLSRVTLALVLVVLVLNEGKETGGGGLVTKFTQAIDTITEAA
jgi:hypothetical protein